MKKKNLPIRELDLIIKQLHKEDNYCILVFYIYTISAHKKKKTKIKIIMIPNCYVAFRIKTVYNNRTMIAWIYKRGKITKNTC